MKLARLRKQYPVFLYKGYSYKLRGKDLAISFDFRILPDIRFAPKVVIKNVGKENLKRVGESNLSNLIFHLGLMEIPSYWKATCSPKIIVQAGGLNSTQVAWWKNLFMQGLGEFFYKNKIDFTAPNFLTIISSPQFLPRPSLGIPRLGLGNRVLVPVGGGKDSAVTL